MKTGDSHDDVSYANYWATESEARQGEKPVEIQLVRTVCLSLFPTRYLLQFVHEGDGGGGCEWWLYAQV